jgi:RNA 2',3'-cyclic 3'-phosphodiesterase
MRTFVAIEVSSEISKAANELVERLARARETVRWVRPENMHLTLKFLGEVEDVRSIEVCRAVQAAVEPFATFPFRCGGVGAFPSSSRPRTVWIGLDQGEHQMIALQEAVDEALYEIGFPRDSRRFHPHLTLGRVKRQCRDLPKLLEQFGQFEAGGMLAREVAVFSSKLESSGPVYMKLGHADLRG